MRLSDLFKPLDQRGFDVWQAKALFATGMGSFTFGYDMPAIGLVLLPVLTTFGITKKSPDFATWASLITSSSLIGIIIGAVIFGYLANKGRKKFYGVDVTLMTIGAILEAFVTSPLQLVIVRGLLGIGLGAESVLTPIIMAEHSNIKDRGKLLSLTGLFFIGGFISAPLIYLALQGLGVSINVLWRIVLSMGAIPAASVIYLRRKIPETPRYILRIQGSISNYESVVKTLTNKDIVVSGNFRDSVPFTEYFKKFYKVYISLILMLYFFNMIPAASTLYGPSLIAPAVGIKNGAVFNLLIAFIFTIPGSILAVLLIDRLGRKTLMISGLIGMATFLLLFSLTRSILPAISSFIIFGFSRFSESVGPDAVTSFIAVELTPTKIRGPMQSITRTAFYAGSITTSFIFPRLPINTAIEILGIIAVIDAVITYFGIPETKGKALEESSGEELMWEETQTSPGAKT